MILIDEIRRLKRFESVSYWVFLVVYVLSLLTLILYEEFYEGFLGFLLILLFWSTILVTIGVFRTRRMRSLEKLKKLRAERWRKLMPVRKVVEALSGILTSDSQKTVVGLLLFTRKDHDARWSAKWIFRECLGNGMEDSVAAEAMMQLAGKGLLEEDEKTAVWQFSPRFHRLERKLCAPPDYQVPGVDDRYHLCPPLMEWEL